MTNKANSVAATDSNSNSDASADSNINKAQTPPTKDAGKRKPALDSMVANADQRRLGQSTKQQSKPSGTGDGNGLDDHPGRPLGTYRTEHDSGR